MTSLFSISIIVSALVMSTNSWAEPSLEELSTIKLGPVTIYESAAPVNQTKYCGDESSIWGSTKRIVLTSLLNPTAKNTFEYTACRYTSYKENGNPVTVEDKIYIYQSSPTKMVLAIAPEFRGGWWSKNLFASLHPVIEKRLQNWTFHQFDLITGVLEEKPLSQWPKDLIRPGLPVLKDCEVTQAGCKPGFRSINFSEEVFLVSDGVALSASMTPATVGGEPHKYVIRIKTSNGIETVFYDECLYFGTSNSCDADFYIDKFRATDNFVAFSYIINKRGKEGYPQQFSYPLNVANLATSKIQTLTYQEGNYEVYFLPIGSSYPLDFFQIDKNTYGYNVEESWKQRGSSYIVNADDLKPVVAYTGAKKISHFSPDGKYFMLEVGNTEVQIVDLKNHQQVVSSLKARSTARLYSVDHGNVLEIDPIGLWTLWSLQDSKFTVKLTGAMNNSLQGDISDPFNRLSVARYGNEVCIRDFSQSQCFKY